MDDRPITVDVVERLRSYDPSTCNRLLWQAANEIERLRALVASAPAEWLARLERQTHRVDL